MLGMTGGRAAEGSVTNGRSQCVGSISAVSVDQAPITSSVRFSGGVEIPRLRSYVVA